MEITKFEEDEYVMCYDTLYKFDCKVDELTARLKKVNTDRIISIKNGFSSYKLASIGSLSCATSEDIKNSKKELEEYKQSNIVRCTFIDRLGDFVFSIPEPLLQFVLMALCYSLAFWIYSLFV